MQNEEAEDEQEVIFFYRNDVAKAEQKLVAEKLWDELQTNLQQINTQYFFLTLYSYVF